MPLYIRILVVVQPGAAHVAVFHAKAQGLDQMQGAACVGTQADDVAGVGRDFGVDEDDVEHAVLSLSQLGGLAGHNALRWPGTGSALSQYT